MSQVPLPRPFTVKAQPLSVCAEPVQNPVNYRHCTLQMYTDKEDYLDHEYKEELQEKIQKI